jgi:hypothetical protein
MPRPSAKFKNEKPWALLGISRRQYEAAKPWKEAGQDRRKFEEIIRLIPPEAVDDLKLEAQAEALLEGVFGDEKAESPAT